MSANVSLLNSANSIQRLIQESLGRVHSPERSYSFHKNSLGGQIRPANVSVPVDAEMKVGAVEETVSVEAALATVDIENVAHPQVLSRTDMDVIPSARNMQSLGSYVPGVHLNTPDVAGSMQVQQTYLTAHANKAEDATYLLDAMLSNSIIGHRR